MGPNLDVASPISGPSWGRARNLSGGLSSTIFFYRSRVVIGSPAVYHVWGIGCRFFTLRTFRTIVVILGTFILGGVVPSSEP